MMEWKKFKEERPNLLNPLGYLVIVEGCDSPMLGQYDMVSKRFYVFCPPINKSIQVPVKWWCEVPLLPID